MLLLLLSVVCLVASTNYPGQPITHLPGFTGVLPNMTSGYITVSQSLGKALFYWLVESTQPNAPLFFWFQGGPGCSGLYGLLTEHGPFRAKSGGLVKNPVSWIDFANVVYLEQPAGVGFSYSNNSAGYNTGDTQSTIDNYAFVQAFLQAYPKFVGRPTYLTGESYGGEYVPSLAATILSNPQTQIYKQLAGIMVGNPVMNAGGGQNLTIAVDIFFWHGLVSYENYFAYNANNCNDNQNSGICGNIWNSIQNEIGEIDQEVVADGAVTNAPSLDPDDLYQNFCTGNASLDYTNVINDNSCYPIGQAETDYLNRADVQAAIHAAESLAPGPWSACSQYINYNANGNSLVPKYQNFQRQKPGFKVLVYSGDVDVATVPMWQTLYALSQVNSVRTQKWGPWFVNGQTAGYWSVYHDYTFASVKGAGHEAPAYVPISAYHMIKRFVQQGNLNDLAPKKKLRRRPSVLTQGKVLRQLLAKQGKRI